MPGFVALFSKCNWIYMKQLKIYLQRMEVRNFWLGWKTLVNPFSRIPSHQVFQYVATEICSEWEHTRGFSGCATGELLRKVRSGRQSRGHQAPFAPLQAGSLPAGSFSSTFSKQRLPSRQLESCHFCFSWWKTIWRDKLKFFSRSSKIGIFIEK